MKFFSSHLAVSHACVAPLAGAWIEMLGLLLARPSLQVAPLAGAWIEIEVRGVEHHKGKVAPLAGAWIEIEWRRSVFERDKVAPLAGAWIEIPLVVAKKFDCRKSLPSRERGLKFCFCDP